METVLSWIQAGAFSRAVDRREVVIQDPLRHVGSILDYYEVKAEALPP